MEKGKEEALKTIVDIIKGISVGSFISSFVGYILQRNADSWVLFLAGVFFTIFSVVLSFLYGRGLATVKV